MRRLSTVAFAAVLTIACSQNGTAQETNDTDQPPAAATSTGQAAAATLALGLTREQLEDADLLNASGVEIGEVEQVVTDTSGAATGLLIEIEDTDPDRLVTIPLSGLTTAPDGHDINIESSLTRAQLLKMPATPR